MLGPRSLALMLALGLPIACGDDSSSTSATSGATATGTDSSGSSGSSGMQTSATGDPSTTGQTSGSTGAASTGEVCEPPTQDVSAIGQECSSDTQCPPGYTCLGFSGVIFRETCAIQCEADCGCPPPTTCVEMSDKARTWMACEPDGG